MIETICFNSSQRVGRTANVLCASPRGAKTATFVKNHRAMSLTYGSGHRARVIADEDDLVAFELSQTHGIVLIDLVAIADLHELPHAFLGSDDSVRVRRRIHRRSTGKGHIDDENLRSDQFMCKTIRSMHVSVPMSQPSCSPLYALIRAIIRPTQSSVDILQVILFSGRGRSYIK